MNYTGVILAYCCRMTTDDLLTTTELANARGVSRQAILMAVSRGTLVPLVILANGYYLFDPASIEALPEGKHDKQHD